MKTVFMLMFLFSAFGLKGQVLDQHQWKNRVLLIEVVDKDSDLYNDQLDELFNAEQQLQERKLVLYIIVNNKYQYSDFKSKKTDLNWKPVRLLGNRFKDNNEPFKITLIGLDGGIKLQQTDILTKDELYKIIDSMPMRAAELNRQ